MASSTVETRRGLRHVFAAARVRRLREVRASFATRRWDVGYRRRLLVTDAVVITLAVTAAHVLRWDRFAQSPVRPDLPAAGYIGVSALVALLWLGSLAVGRTHDPRILGSGPTEYQRVFDATWKLFGLLAVAAFLLRFAEARAYLVYAFPLGLLGVLATRYAWRQRLHARRGRGECTTAVLAIGHRDQAERLIREMNHRLGSGYRVVGVCVPSGQVLAGESILDVPVLGDLRGAGAIAAQVGADCVAVSGSDAITADVVRRLGWELEPVGVDLMLTTELADVAGPRITVTPAETVSLLHVDAPRFTGPKFVVKSVMDGVGAVLATIVALPVLVVVAAAVGLTSRGGIFFTQQRVGRGGETFPMIKFRTMRVGADRETAVLGAGNDGAGPLFKRRDDPRVTRVGRVLRRYSLDELPQLFNVLAGHMSLVGPRPPLEREVSAYEQRMRRRLLVKPGLTGLWQVGGRSDLTWEESVRLDVYYVENWTAFGDVLILARTAKAVFGGRGAY